MPQAVTSGHKQSHTSHVDLADQEIGDGDLRPSKLAVPTLRAVEQDEVVVRLSHDEALVLFEWLCRTDELTNDFGDLVEDQAEQRALWNLNCLLERVLIEPFQPDYQELVEQARSRLRAED